MDYLVSPVRQQIVCLISFHAAIFVKENWETDFLFVGLSGLCVPPETAPDKKSTKELFAILQGLGVDQSAVTERWPWKEEKRPKITFFL